MSRWYVIQCKARQETRALENLERQGFSCYLPMLTVEKLRRGSTRDVLEPLFPAYLFINLNELSDNWHPIRSTRGVLQIVRFNQYPVPVRDEIIDQIRHWLANDPIKVPYLRPGERVLITDGCFANLEAVFVSPDGPTRVVLLLNILHHEQTLSFPTAAVRKLAGSNSPL
jgi:transcriptional antiterminator RfaH